VADFSYIMQVSGFVFGTVVRADSPWRTWADLLAEARRRPGQLTYSTSGIATTNHLAMEDILAREGLRMEHIPTRGAQEGVTMLLGRQIDMVCDAQSWRPQVESGEFRLLAAWTPTRLGSAPDAPTLRELGYGMSVTSPYGIVGPKGLDPEVIDILHRAFRKAMQDEASQAIIRRWEMPEGVSRPGGVPRLRRRACDLRTRHGAKAEPQHRLAPREISARFRGGPGWALHPAGWVPPPEAKPRAGTGEQRVGKASGAVRAGTGCQAQRASPTGPKRPAEALPWQAAHPTRTRRQSWGPRENAQRFRGELVPQQRRAPGQAAADRLQQQEVAALDAAVIHRLRQGQRHRGGRGVGVAIHRHHHAFPRQAELLAHGVDDADVGWCGTRNLTASRSRPLASSASSTTAASLVTACLNTSRPAIFRMPVPPVVPAPPSMRRMSPWRPSECRWVERMPRSIVPPSGLGLGAQHHGAGAVAEQHAGGAVGQSRMREYNSVPMTEGAARLAGLEQRVGDGHRIRRSPVHGCRHVEGEARGSAAELALDQHRRGRKPAIPAVEVAPMMQSTSPAGMPARGQRIARAAWCPRPDCRLHPGPARCAG
jgi:hypothetical protein